MPMPSEDVPLRHSDRGFLRYVHEWGENSLPPTVTATLITAQHLRPFRVLPMLFPPVLLFSSYLHINGFQKDAAGLNSAWSAAYIVLAQRRRHSLRQKLGARGFVRGLTILLCVANVAGGGLTYALRDKDGDP